MGRTKTVCYCNNRRCKTSSPAGKQQRFEDMRRELASNLEQYLSEEVCVPGVAAEDLRVDPIAELLTRAYRRTLHQMVMAIDEQRFPDVLRLGALMADVLRELVAIPTLLPSAIEIERVPGVEPSAMEQHRGDLQRFLERYVTVSSEPKEALEYDRIADLLGRSYCRALAELEAALRERELFSIFHHTALLADLVGEMIQLWILRTEHYTEEFLPEDHPHASAQDKIIAESS
jgi:hypothetical protein